MNVKVANFERFAKISPPENVRFKNIEAAQEYLEFDAVCDIAKAKTHGMMKLTLCVKNLFGLVKGSERMGWHLAVGRDFAMFADMLLDIYLTVRPQFNLLDAITCTLSGSFPKEKADAVFDTFHAAHRKGLLRNDRSLRAMLLTAITADTVRQVEYGPAIFQLQGLRRAHLDTQPSFPLFEWI